MNGSTLLCTSQGEQLQDRYREVCDPSDMNHKRAFNKPGSHVWCHKGEDLRSQNRLHIVETLPESVGVTAAPTCSQTFRKSTNWCIIAHVCPVYIVRLAANTAEALLKSFASNANTALNPWLICTFSILTLYYVFCAAHLESNLALSRPPFFEMPRTCEKLEKSVCTFW